MFGGYSQRIIRGPLALLVAAALCAAPAHAAGLSRTARDQAQPPSQTTTPPAQAPASQPPAAPEDPGRARIVATGDTAAQVLSALPRPVLGPVVVSPTATVAGTLEIAPVQPPPVISAGPGAVLAPGQRLVIGTRATETPTVPGVVQPAPQDVVTLGAVQARLETPRVPTNPPAPQAPPVTPTAPAQSILVSQAATAAPRSRIGPAEQPAQVPAPPQAPVAAPAQAPTQAVSPATGERPPVTDLLKPPPARFQPAATALQGADSAGSGAAQQFTPASAAALASQNSIDLQITAANIADAEAQLRQTFGLDDFRVSVSATIGRRGPIASATFPGGEDGEETVISLGDADIRTGAVNAVKPLYTSGRIERTQQVALKALETRKLSRAVIERALDLAARQLVYEILRVEQLAEVAQERANAVAAHVDLSKKLMVGGVVPKFEVVQAETELARARGEVISARTGVEQAKSSLRRVLTLPQQTPVGVGLGDAPQAPSEAITELIEQAWEARPEIRTAQASVALAEASLRLAFTTRNVSVNLVGGVTAAQASFGSEPLGWQIAISAEKPLLDAKQERGEVEKAKAQLDAAKLELERQRQEVALEVTQAHLALDDGRQRLEVAQQGVVEAQERLRISRVRYENGLALGVEVLDAQTALTTAQAEVVNAEYSLYSAIIRLRSSVGLWSGNE